MLGGERENIFYLIDWIYEQLSGHQSPLFLIITQSSRCFYSSRLDQKQIYIINFFVAFLWTFFFRFNTFELFNALSRALKS